MPKMTVKEFLENESWIIAKADRIVPAYNLEERMNSRMWATCINIIDLKINILENFILELRGLQKRLKSMMGNQ